MCIYEYTDLSDCIFQKGNFTQTHYRSCDFEDSDFTESKLEECNFSYCNLIGLDISNATLENCNFTNSICINWQENGNPVDFEDSKWNGVFQKDDVILTVDELLKKIFTKDLGFTEEQDIVDTRNFLIETAVSISLTSDKFYISGENIRIIESINSLSLPDKVLLVDVINNHENPEEILSKLKISKLMHLNRSLAGFEDKQAEDQPPAKKPKTKESISLDTLPTSVLGVISEFETGNDNYVDHRKNPSDLCKSGKSFVEAILNEKIDEHRRRL